LSVLINLLEKIEQQKNGLRILPFSHSKMVSPVPIRIVCKKNPSFYFSTKKNSYLCTAKQNSVEPFKQGYSYAFDKKET